MIFNTLDSPFSTFDYLKNQTIIIRHDHNDFEVKTLLYVADSVFYDQADISPRVFNFTGHVIEYNSDEYVDYVYLFDSGSIIEVDNIAARGKIKCPSAAGGGNKPQWYENLWNWLWGGVISVFSGSGGSPNNSGGSWSSAGWNGGWGDHSSHEGDPDNDTNENNGTENDPPELCENQGKYWSEVDPDVKKDYVLSLSNLLDELEVPLCHDPFAANSSVTCYEQSNILCAADQGDCIDPNTFDEGTFEGCMSEVLYALVNESDDLLTLLLNQFPSLVLTQPEESILLENPNLIPIIQYYLEQNGGTLQAVNHVHTLFGILVASPSLADQLLDNEVLDLLGQNYDLTVAMLDIIQGGEFEPYELYYVSETTILLNTLINAGLFGDTEDSLLENVWASTVERLGLSGEYQLWPFSITKIVMTQMANECIEEGGGILDCWAKAFFTVIANKRIIKELGDQLEYWANLGGYELPSTYEEWYVMGAVIYPILGEISLDMTPGIGDAKAFADAFENLQDENYGTAGFDFVTGILGFLHVGKVVDAVSGTLDAIKVSLKSIKLIQVLADFSANIAQKLKSFIQQGWAVLWDTNVGKLIVKNDSGDEVAEIFDDAEELAPNIRVKDPIARDLLDINTLKTLEEVDISSPGTQSLANEARRNPANHIRFEPGDLQSQVDDILQNGDNLTPPGPGQKTEALTRAYIDGNDGWIYQTGGKYGSDNGYDNVFYNPNTGEVLIDESKNWPPVLTGETPTNPKQMSDLWIEKVAQEIEDAGDGSLANIIRNALNNGKLFKTVSVVKRTNPGKGSIITIKLGG